MLRGFLNVGVSSYRLLVIVVISVIFFPSFFAFAQTNFTIVTTYPVAGDNIIQGDIISFDPEEGIHSLSSFENDEEMFGVVQDDPVVVFRTGKDKIPIAQLGEIFVNVTLIGGAISLGDSITTSKIPGKGKKFSSDSGYILGTALQSFDTKNSTETIKYEEEEIASGKILVALDMGPFRGDVEDVLPPTVIVNNVNETGDGPSTGTIFRYILATMFAAVSLYLVFRNFGPTLAEGVSAVGRNPLAKSTIQSMVTFNMILVLIISVASLMVSLVIILLPV